MNAFDITFLGTSAWDYNPRLQTDLKHTFDRNARRSSALLINQHYLLDCGEHTLNSLDILRKDLREITDIFITHLHADHFNPKNIEAIALAKEHPLNLWISADAQVPEIKNVNIIRMERHVRYTVDNHFTICGMKANHDESTFPQHLLMEHNGKKFLYACDGAWFLTSTFNFLKDAHLDLCVLDGTCGDYSGDFRMAEHNSIPMIRLMLPSLKNRKTIDENTLVYISHLAPSLHKPHDETVEICKKDNILVAYDGLHLQL